MSNFEAGKLYEAVVEEVIADSRQDFEDSGIDESTLQELKKLWCDKLSQFKVCRFSWDDENDERHHIQEGVIDESTMKSEPLQLNANLDLPIIPNFQPSTSIPSLDLTNGSYSMGIELPSVKQEIDEGGLVLPANQSDGPFEMTISLPQNRAQSYLSRLRENMKAQADGPGSLDDDDDDDVFNDSDDINSDLDDDLDSEKSDEEDGDQEGQIMLCLYDKVQRVKNKWKCNLKEGVANIDGRDYVFQRAAGESEW
ncbi:hypothetical protein METBIDRAFT_39319 [Metschnikowia bicuspidata var. bicuspidata NRRL YB-4993]|uniref:Transcription initiation factor IIA large subunit n=1 Tax=Metschnikowia bicuspidata var. bicuspidata NRRL YB-4993 TaxID=869754 RepID=A0A1A0HE90_9ASCO|nr:hypothetical protein METBIDRAFT_39319 [Metschnikowia bicuspidata var. bicuspidata NRRL YB-4993]OBA22217.1 hypothetical protein METBIDRAFT_39319 [Metschnikowia bicuspidata var. bicuspidata NRRL YB-4993]